LHIVHAFLDRKWNPKTKILNNFSLFPAFVVGILHFRVKKAKSLSKIRNVVFLKSVNMGVLKNPQFHAGFRSEEIFKKCALVKSFNKKMFCLGPDFIAGKTVFGIILFWGISSQIFLQISERHKILD
jgi:hypothetical protein